MKKPRRHPQRHELKGVWVPENPPEPLRYARPDILQRELAGINGLSARDFYRLAGRGVIAPFGTAGRDIAAVIRGKKPISLIAREHIEVSLEGGLIVELVPPLAPRGPACYRHAAYRDRSHFVRLCEVLETFPDPAEIRDTAAEILAAMAEGLALGYSEADVCCYALYNVGYRPVREQLCRLFGVDTANIINDESLRSPADRRSLAEDFIEAVAVQRNRKQFTRKKGKRT